MSFGWFSLQSTHDPVRLVLPSSPQNLSTVAASPSSAVASITLGSRGDAGANYDNGVTSVGFDYLTTIGSWWGQRIAYNNLSSGSIDFPGNMYDAQLQVISGNMASINFGDALNTWLPLTLSASWLFIRTTTGSNSGTLRLMFRRTNTVTVLAQTDFNISLSVSSTISNHTVNVEDLGIFGLGFISGNGGSLSPTTFRGQTVNAVLSPSISGLDVAIGILGSHPQNFFNDITIQTKTGSTINLLSSNASYSVGGTPTTTNWSWNSAGEIWDFSTVGLNRSLTFTF